MENKNTTIIYYGGAFDPPTPSHFRIIKDLQDKVNRLSADNLNKVYMLLIGITNNDEKNYSLPYACRDELMKNGLTGENLSALVYEQSMRTAETLRAIMRAYKDQLEHIILAVGEDEYNSLMKKEWVDSDWILNHVELCVYPRVDGVSSSKLRRGMQLDPLFVWHNQEMFSQSVANSIMDNHYYNQEGPGYHDDEDAFIATYKRKPIAKVTAILEDLRKGVITTDEAYGQIAKADFPHPSVTATVIVHNLSNDKYLLIRRKNFPYKNYMAFPGGFAEPSDDSIEQTAVRELKEECGIEVDPKWLHPIKLYRANDPRGWIFDYFFVVNIYGNQAEKVVAGDDAGDAVWVSGEDIVNTKLAFHHSDAFTRFYGKKNS